MGFGKQEGIDDGQLDWTKRSSKLPVPLGSRCDIACGRKSSVSLDPELLGEIQPLGVFVVDLVFWLRPGVDKREGSDSKSLLECKFT